jgi:type II secretory pathway predicted ATPase ExeA
MYQEYWGLSRKPFENDLSPDFLYLSEKHEEALVRMLYAVSEHKSLMLLVGDGGMGKSMLAHVFFGELSRRRYRGAYLSFVEDSPDSLMRQWMHNLGFPTDRGDFITRLETLQEYAAAGAVEGRETVLAVDDAEHIKNYETLDLIKNLLSLEHGGRRLFTVFLIGQKPLLGRVQAHAGLRASVDITYALKPFSADETKNYLLHRLRLVGGKPAIFAEDAINEIHAFSQGIPKIINSVADMALFAAAGKGLDKITAAVVAEAKTELLQLKEA